MEASAKVVSLESSTKNFRGSKFAGSFHGVQVWKLSRASTKNANSASGPIWASVEKGRFQQTNPTE